MSGDVHRDSTAQLQHAFPVGTSLKACALLMPSNGARNLNICNSPHTCQISQVPDTSEHIVVRVHVRMRVMRMERHCVVHLLLLSSQRRECFRPEQHVGAHVVSLATRGESKDALRVSLRHDHQNCAPAARRSCSFEGHWLVACLAGLL